MKKTNFIYQDNSEDEAFNNIPVTPTPDEDPQPCVSDGSTASYYQLPENARELQEIISYLDLNAQLGEIMRSAYRYGRASHSDKLRDIRKIKFYAQAEEERLLKYIKNN